MGKEKKISAFKKVKIPNKTGGGLNRQILKVCLWYLKFRKFFLALGDPFWGGMLFFSEYFLVFFFLKKKVVLQFPEARFFICYFDIISIV